MRFRSTLPRVTSTVQTSPGPLDITPPILDGHLPMFSNVWRIPSNTVALCGRPAIWFALDVTIPHVHFGPIHIKRRRVRWEQDFGGHLYVIIVRDVASEAILLEGGPYFTGTGALAPYAYAEDVFFNREMIDFDPVAIAPPNGLTQDEFADLLINAHREYDGNQRYTAIEIPFLRVGRDSNSYAIGMLLAAGLDLREIPKPYRAHRFEWSGYPGAEDPVHRANFGGYLGEPGTLADGTLTATYHGERGNVLYVTLAGEPQGSATLPDGTTAALDRFGRCVLAEKEAELHGLPLKHTPPPPHIANRVRFPEKPAAAGANITFVADGVSVPLDVGDSYSGKIVARNDALNLATMRTKDGVNVTMPINELGVEMRDPKRLDAALKVGEYLTVGLHSDRRPKLHLRGRPNIGRSAFTIAPESAAVAAVFLIFAGAAIALFRARRT